mmetsp:Transcript_6936/g.17074  ORF Transcript_6936/g.17074 Transcript_6936/m.17074 type:complete len:248 (+) Transcript_6936:329-1072(+)
MTHAVGQPVCPSVVNAVTLPTWHWRIQELVCEAGTNGAQTIGVPVVLWLVFTPDASQSVLTKGAGGVHALSDDAADGEDKRSEDEAIVLRLVFAPDASQNVLTGWAGGVHALSDDVTDGDGPGAKDEALLTARCTASHVMPTGMVRSRRIISRSDTGLHVCKLRAIACKALCTSESRCFKRESNLSCFNVSRKVPKPPGRHIFWKIVMEARQYAPQALRNSANPVQRCASWCSVNPSSISNPKIPTA